MDQPKGPRRNPAAERAVEMDFSLAWGIVDDARDGILVCDREGVILMANQQVEVMFGTDRDALIGAPIQTLLPAWSPTAHEAWSAEYITASTTRPMGINPALDLRGRRADGTEFPIEIDLSPVASGHGTAIIVNVRETSRQSAALIPGEDERIAADLHDSVVRRLFRAGLTLTSILGRGQVESEVAEQMREVIGELDSAIAETRKAVFDRQGTATDVSSASRIAQAGAHVRNALAVVDGLLADASTGPSERASYQLGEANHAMHYALIALNECVERPPITSDAL